MNRSKKRKVDAMSLEADIRVILKFQKERDWKKFHLPKNLAISLSLEAAEILEIFQWSKNNQLPKGEKDNLAMEIADVYYYLLLLAHETGIDIGRAFQKKMMINSKKYPVKKAKGNSVKYNKF